MKLSAGRDARDPRHRDRDDLPGPDDLAQPGLPIGEQIAEPIRAHEDVSKARRAARAIELLEPVGIPDPAARRTTTRTSSRAACASA